MAAVLRCLVRHYTGKTSDDLPVSTETDPIPVGSVYLAEETGREASWNGRQWVWRPSDLVVDKLDAMLQCLLEIKVLHEAQIAVLS